MTSESVNKKKLRTFFSKEYLSLRAFVKSRINDVADREADDIIQDVALNMFSRADSLSPISNVAGFVYNSIKNKIIDTFRTSKQKSYFDDQFEAVVTDFAELFYGKSDNTYSVKMKDELKSAISNLKSDYQDIIIAVDFEGYSYQELSKEWNIPVGTLLSRRHRALSLLIKQFENFKKTDT